MIKLKHLYKISELPPFCRDFFGHRFYQEVIPTETIISEWGEVSIPFIKRSYETRLYLLRGDVVDYDTLCNEEPNFKGTSAYPNLYMREVWEDYGDDGHVGYELQGFMFTTDDDDPTKIDYYRR